MGENWQACPNFQGDGTLMKQQLDWSSGRPYEYQLLNMQARTAAFAGRLREARLFSRRAQTLAKQRDSIH